MVGIENEPITLEDRESKEVSLTKIHVEKYCDALISQVTYGDPSLKKPSEPPKPILKPLPCGLGYTFLKDIEPITPYEDINPLICKQNIYYKEDDPGDTYILDVIVEEDHVRYKDKVKESCPLKFDYEKPYIFDPS